MQAARREVIFACKANIVEMPKQSRNRKWTHTVLRILTIVWIVIAAYFTLIAGLFAVRYFFVRNLETVIPDGMGAMLYTIVAVSLWVSLIYYLMCRQED